ncbi:MAG: hypothetical protein AB1716_14260 [Planctomycetota bacterium]
MVRTAPLEREKDMSVIRDRWVGVVLLAWSCLALAAAQPQGGYCEVARITPPDPNVLQLGLSLAMSGDTVVVGAPEAEIYGLSTGTAYVLRRDAGGPERWGIVARVLQPDPVPDEHFGWAVAIDGDTVAVGAPFGTPPDRVLIYYRNQGGPEAWGLVTQLLVYSHDFGCSLSLSGDRLLVGRDEGALMFERNQGGPDHWGQVAVFPNPGTTNNYYGWSVGLSGDTAVIGAFRDDTHGWLAGGAFVYRRDAGGPNCWGQVAELRPDPPQNPDRFGRAVAIAGDTIVVGADQDAYMAAGTGYASVYGRDQGGPENWGLLARLTAEENRLPQDCFGAAVAVCGDLVAVGAPRWIGSGRGKLCLYSRNHGGSGQWGQLATFYGWVALNGLFGSAVATNGPQVLASAPTGAGAVFAHANDATIRAGDVNCDGRVDFGDINYFVLMLSRGDQWRLRVPVCPYFNGDTNGDGAVNFGDINGFVAALSGSL